MDLTPITQLGTAGFAIFVLWQTSKMFMQSMEKEREESRKVEKEVRESIMQQLSENTLALTKVMQYFRQK